MTATVFGKAPSDLEKRVVGQVARLVFWGDRTGGPWEVEAPLRHETITIPGNGGATLAARWFPAERPVGTVVLAHPDKRYAQHWFVREGWVGWLLRHHLNVLTFDFAGYGESVDGSTFLHEDVIAAAREAQRRAEGKPVHVIGVSLGAFAVANAAPRLDFVESLVLESPYPSFAEWYPRGIRRAATRAFNALFPRSARTIDLRRNLPRAAPKRILVAASADDRVTRVALSREVARHAPDARWLEVSGVAHLGLLASPEYRAAVLDVLGVPQQSDLSKIVVR